MNQEQYDYIASLNESSHNEIFIKKTGREGINLPLHTHSLHQILFTLSGTLHIQIGGTSYFVPERHIVWIGPNVEHILSSNNRQIALVIFYCDLKSANESDSGQRFAIYNTNSFVWENMKFISTANDKIVQETTPDLYSYTLSFLRLLPGICHNYQLPLQSLVTTDDKRLQPVLDYIRSHSSEALTVEGVAQQFGFSVRNLSRLFQDADIRFINYLNYQRITRAIELFADKNKTIKQIAYDVGFNSPNSFNRVFKQILGKSPGAFFRP